MSSNIEKIRKKLGLSQAAFAKAIGKGQSTVANYETGYRKPEPDTAYIIIDLAKSLGIQISLEDIYSRN